MDNCWKPHVTVAAVIEREGRFLLVEEETDEGLRLNQPAGHLEKGESLVQAVSREVLEETAFLFMPEYIVGIYRWTPLQGDRTYLRFVFGGQAGESAIAGRRLDDGIVRTHWLTTEEIRASRLRHRSPLLERCLDDWIAGRRFALEMIDDV